MTVPPIGSSQTSSAAVGAAGRIGEGSAGRDGDGQRRSEKSPQAFRTISEVAQDLDVPPHVLRFWETRFSQVRPLKRGGGRRYYRPEDVDLLRRIRSLLYQEGYTIKGVQRVLREGGTSVAAQAAGAAAAQRGLPAAEAGRGDAADPVEQAEDGLTEKGREAGGASRMHPSTPIGSGMPPSSGEAQGQAAPDQGDQGQNGQGGVAGPTAGSQDASSQDANSQGDLLSGNQAQIPDNGIGGDTARLSGGGPGHEDGRPRGLSHGSNGPAANGGAAATGQPPMGAEAGAAEWRERLGKVLVDLRTVQAVIRQELGDT